MGTDNQGQQPEVVGEIAFTTIIQALARTIAGLDEVPPEERNSDMFLHAFDGYIGVLNKMNEKSGVDPEKAQVDAFRLGLEMSLNRAANLRRDGNESDQTA